MTAIWNELHTFLIYAVFGYALVFPLALLCLKLFSIDHPGQRRQLYLLALLTPVIGFVLYHTVFMKRCQGGLLSSGKSGELLHLFCTISDNALRYAAPILAVLISLGLLKAVFAVVLIRRLRFQAIHPHPGLADRIKEIFRLRCGEIGINYPEVIYSSRNGFVAFTAGLFKPVLVLNSSLTAEMSDQELDAVLTHELVHIKRKDNVKGWLIYFLRDITFFNPISSILLRRIMFETERVCDREAVRLTGQKADTYAAVLLRIWRLLLEQKPFKTGLVSAFTSGKNDMENRVTALLKSHNDEKITPAIIFVPVIMIFMSASLLYLGLIC